MGLIQSIICSVVFCIERIFTYACCAFLLMLMMATIVVLMIYGISVGYHYAQKEMASIAGSRTTTEQSVTNKDSGSTKGEVVPLVRMLAVNRSSVERAPRPILEIQEMQRPNEVYLPMRETPVMVLETERPPKKPELSPQERELARRLIGRYRRSKNMTSVVPFLRPLNSTEPPFRAIG